MAEGRNGNGRVVLGLLLAVAGAVWLAVDLKLLEWRHFLPTMLIALGAILVLSLIHI